MKPLGHTRWAIPAGHIPADSTGPEPEFTSRDQLWLLNTGGEQVALEITILRPDADPVGPYRLELAGERVLNVRVNDLIDPEAPPLGRDYGVVIEAEGPIVVQQLQLDSRRAEDSISSTIGFGSSPPGE